jgi:hypothetical protein
MPKRNCDQGKAGGLNETTKRTFRRRSVVAREHDSHYKSASRSRPVDGDR